MTSNEERSPWMLVTTGIHDRGGQDKANFALAEYLLGCDTPVHLVSHSVDAALARHPFATLHRVPRPPGPFFLSEQVLDRWGRRAARQLLVRSPSARILVNGGNCMWPGINWSHYVHKAWDPNSSHAPLWYRAKAAFNQRLSTAREERAYRQAQVILTNSDNTRDHILQSYAVLPERIRTVHLGCDSSWGPVTASERAESRQTFGIGLDETVAIFVGGIGWDERKGFDLILDAWRTLSQSDRRWDVKLIVAGDGAAVPIARRHVAEAGLDGQIRFLGFTRHIKALLATADLLLSPVRYEPYGLNVQEAICRAVPSIVSAHAGIAERYPTAVGDLLLQGEPDLSEVIRSLLVWRNSVELWKMRFEKFSAELRNYTWSHMSAQMVSTVDEVLQDNRRLMQAASL